MKENIFVGSVYGEHNGSAVQAVLDWQYRRLHGLNTRGAKVFKADIAKRYEFGAEQYCREFAKLGRVYFICPFDEFKDKCIKDYVEEVAETVGKVTPIDFYADEFDPLFLHKTWEVEQADTVLFFASAYGTEELALLFYALGLGKTVVYLVYDEDDGRDVKYPADIAYEYPARCYVDVEHLTEFLAFGPTKYEQLRACKEVDEEEV